MPQVTPTESDDRAASLLVSSGLAQESHSGFRRRPADLGRWVLLLAQAERAIGICARFSARLRSSRVPERLRFLASLPFDEMGKLLRRAVRTILAD